MKGESIMNLKAKLTSRKFWAAVAGIVVGLVVAFGGDRETIELVSGGVLSVISALSFVFVEGGVDKASANAPLHVENVHIGAETSKEEGAGDNDAESD